MFRAASLRGLLLICAVFAAYIPALGGGFIWDDPVLLTENPLIWLPGGLREMWLGAHTPDFIPVTLTGFWLEWRLWGADPAGYHAVNILLHAANAVLFWRILLKLGVRGAWVGALLFALHPMNAASVAWVAERKNTLSLLFTLASVALWLKLPPRGAANAGQTPRRTAWHWYLLSLLAGIAAMLSKGATVVLPALLILVEWWRCNSPNRGALRSISLRLCPFVAASITVAWITLHFQARAVTIGIAEPLFARTVHAAWALGFYFWKTFWPVGLSPIYPKWGSPVGIWDLLPLALVAIALTVLITRLHSPARRAFGFALGVFTIALLPVLGLVARPAFFDQAPVADWWNYLPILGLCGLAGAIFDAGLRRFDAPRFSHAAAGTIVLTLGTLTWMQASIYEDMETYCQATVRRNPHAWIARNNLGMVWANRGRSREAIEQYTLALRDNPHCSEAHLNLAAVLSEAGQTAPAEAHLRQLLATEPNHAKARNNLGSLMFQTGRIDEAISELKTSLKLFPYNPAALNNLGLALSSKGSHAEALGLFRAALTLDPGNANAWFNAGRTFSAQSRHDLAANAFTNALRSSPAWTAASNQLAQELIAAGHPGNAEAEILRFFQRFPQKASDPILNKTLTSARALNLKPAMR